ANAAFQRGICMTGANESATRAARAPRKPLQFQGSGCAALQIRCLLGALCGSAVPRAGLRTLRSGRAFAGALAATGQYVVHEIAFEVVNELRSGWLDVLGTAAVGAFDLKCVGFDAQHLGSFGGRRLAVLGEVSDQRAFLLERHLIGVHRRHSRSRGCASDNGWRVTGLLTRGGCVLLVLELL